MSECHMERVIRAFVLERTAERVELSLSKAICIRHIKKTGNILLAVFWAKVLQHPRNFPPTRYTYQKETTDQGDLLKLKANDNIEMTVYMATGKLKIHGCFVYEWFKNTFLQLLTNFDGGFDPDDIPVGRMARQVAAEEEKPRPIITGRV